MGRGIGERPERSPSYILQQVDYPCTRDDLVRAAEDDQAPVDTLNFLRALPDRQYQDPDEVLRQFAEADLRFAMGGRPLDVHRGNIGKDMHEPKGGPMNHP